MHGGKVSKTYIVTVLTLFSLVVSSRETDPIPPKSSHPAERESHHLQDQPEETLDISSDLQSQSLSPAQHRDVAEATETNKKRKKKKPKKILRVESGAKETVQVPDNMEWDHNKKDQDQQIRDLRQEIDSGMPKE